MYIYFLWLYTIKKSCPKYGKKPSMFNQFIWTMIKCEKLTTLAEIIVIASYYYYVLLLLASPANTVLKYY